jgi:1-acylglycerol-3-phosphate O-acyltransferase
VKWLIQICFLLKRSSSLNKNNARLPQDNSIIASSSTSPIDALYLAAIFDPVFTASFPTTRLVEPITLFQAMLRAFSPPQMTPHPKARLIYLDSVLTKYKGRVIVVFPECTTNNGRGILPFSPSLLTAPPNTKVFPVHLRYTAPDITTPIPGSFFTFLWNLCSKPTHCIRIRIAEAVFNTSLAQQSVSSGKTATFKTNYFDSLTDDTASSADTLVGDESEGPVTREEKAFLDKIGEALARLGRVRRVALGVREKQDFVKSWTRSQR